MEIELRKILLEIYKANKDYNDEAVEKILLLFDVMHRSFQGTNGYAIEHLINDTYQVVDRIDGTCHKQGSKRDCENYLNGA